MVEEDCGLRDPRVKPKLVTVDADVQDLAIESLQPSDSLERLRYKQ